jgi:hypothetical protein
MPLETLPYLTLRPGTSPSQQTRGASIYPISAEVNSNFVGGTESLDEILNATQFFPSFIRFFLPRAGSALQRLKLFRRYRDYQYEARLRDSRRRHAGNSVLSPGLFQEHALQPRRPHQRNNILLDLPSRHKCTSFVLQSARFRYNCANEQMPLRDSLMLRHICFIFTWHWTAVVAPSSPLQRNSRLVGRCATNRCEETISMIDVRSSIEFERNWA